MLCEIGIKLQELVNKDYYLRFCLISHLFTVVHQDGPGPISHVPNPGGILQEANLTL